MIYAFLEKEIPPWVGTCLAWAAASLNDTVTLNEACSLGHRAILGRSRESIDFEHPSPAPLCSGFHDPAT